MSKAYIFYNPIANNNKGADVLPELNAFIQDEMIKCDMTAIDYNEVISSMEDGDYIVICGGDGTLNRFANTVDCEDLKHDVLYYAAGTGNDFANDLGKKRGDAPYSIKKYLVNLPTVTINGKTTKFINGIGFGIDGYCCEEGDRLRAAGASEINYTSIAIKGLFGKFKPTGGTFIVDGVEHKYKKIWIAPTMHGRYYGGGIMPCPDQRREHDVLSVLVFYGTGRLKTLTIFPTLFQGTHAQRKKNVAIFSGKQITVKFAQPRTLQIDGETIFEVTEYTANR